MAVVVGVDVVVIAMARQGGVDSDVMMTLIDPGLDLRYR